jgi:hypothetical protein
VNVALTDSIHVFGEGYVAPDGLNNSVKNYVEANGGVSWSPVGPLTLKVGYRHVSVDGKEGRPNHTLIDGAYVAAALSHLLIMVQAMPPRCESWVRVTAVRNKKNLREWQVVLKWRDHITAAHHHQLLVHKLFDPEIGELPAITGTLHAAKRQLRRGIGQPVDIDHPGFNGGGHPFGAFDILTEHRAAQAIVESLASAFASSSFFTT